MPRDLRRWPDLTRGRPAAGDAVSAASLSVGCDGRVILDSLSFSFPARRATCIVGPGGSGKSTLLRTLALEGHAPAPLWASGEVRMDGIAALCPQRGRDPLPTAAQTLGSAISKVSPAETVARAWAAVPSARRQLLRLLDHDLTDVPAALRRLAEITPALASDADVLLLDEPDAGASASTLDWIMAQLAETKTRCTVVIATHHLRFARQLSDEVLLLLDGTVVEHAPAQAFFEHPTTARAASYVLMGS